MSSTRQIVQDLIELVHSLDELLQTEMATKAPAIAIELGAGIQLNQAIDFLNGLLEQIKSSLATIRDPLMHVSALSGLLGLLEPFVNAIAALTDISDEQLAKIGLTNIEEINGPVSDAVIKAKTILLSGKQVIDDVPSDEDLVGLLDRIEDLIKRLLACKAMPREAVAT